MRKKGWIASALLLTAIILILSLGIERGSAPELVLFLGRFHPTVVHFPIALLLVAAAIEFLAVRSARVARARPAVPFVLAVGALSALASVVLGYLLSLEGGYEEGLLSLHMWLGIIVTVGAFGFALFSAWSKTRGKVYRGMMGALALLVIVAGHLGGSLSRGSDYLTYYLPAPVKGIIGLNSDVPSGLIANVDSALVFDALVQPILERRCVTCHGPNKSKGDLRLDSREGIEAGGRDGRVLVAGNPAQSEIVRRITLPPFDEDAMPPDGEVPLDVGETELIRWWIASGASFELRVAEMDEKPTAVETYLARVSRPPMLERSRIFSLDVPEPDTLAVADLEKRGFGISRITPDAPFLHVSARSVRSRLSDADLEALRTIAPQIAVLDIGHTDITDVGAEAIREMPHLIHLHLEGTRIGDATLERLSGLEYLEYLNLYGSMISDDGLAHLESLPALEAVYLWQTRVTEEGARRLRRARSNTDVNTGGRLGFPSDSTDASLLRVQMRPVSSASS